MITVFGSVNLDLIATVERLPAPGETVAGRSFVTAPGGKGANQALAAARAGSPVRLVGAVGTDAFAGEALRLLREDGVDLAGLAEVEVPTGTALILVDPAGENVIAVVPGANAAVTQAQGEALRFQAGDVLLMQIEIPEVPMRTAIRQARASGALVLLNGAPFTDAVPRLAGAATHLILNEHEFERLCGSLALPPADMEARLRALAGQLGSTVIVTLGSAGALACTGAEITRAAALPVAATDTVGAGDTFCGFLAAELQRGTGLGDALRFAAAAGSLACTRAGAQPAIPTRAEVLAAISPA